MRGCGILLPVFSLPSKYGIGSFSKEAFDFVDFLNRSGQGYWQILPLGPTGYSNSPYQSISSFAGNPDFISFEKLIEEGLLSADEVNSVNFGADPEKADYGALYEGRRPLLKTAAKRLKESFSEEEELKKEYDEFLLNESYWLKDYCLYAAIKEANENKPWLEWDEELKERKPQGLKEAEKKYEEETEAFALIQFIFDRQWKALHKYAKKNNVEIIGDLPFFAAVDSADVWANQKAFKLDKELKPAFSAGTPPDAFSPKGQVWRMPVYDWEAERNNGYSFWLSRFKRNFALFDIVRLDHFHGFSECFEIPFDDEDALKGKMVKGPGDELFDIIFKKYGEGKLIAEDLGNVTRENEELLERTKIPGMNILEYAFTSWDSKYMTHRQLQNSVVYTGNHDNAPLRAWIEDIGDGSRDFLRRYVNSINTDYGKLTWDTIREAYRSVAFLSIVPLYDYLVLGREARLNTPGTDSGNWQWRLRPNLLSADLERSIRELADTYCRLPQEKPAEEEETQK